MAYAVCMAMIGLPVQRFIAFFCILVAFVSFLAVLHVVCVLSNGVVMEHEMKNRIWLILRTKGLPFFDFAVINYVSWIN